MAPMFRGKYSDIYTAEEISELANHEREIELRNQKQYRLTDSIILIGGLACLVSAILLLFFVRLDRDFESGVWIFFKITLLVMGVVFSPIFLVSAWRHHRSVQLLKRFINGEEFRNQLKSVA